MSSKLPRITEKDNPINFSQFHNIINGKVEPINPESAGKTISTLWISEGHARNRKTGTWQGGGPFHVTHTGPFYELGSVYNAFNGTERVYSGPVIGIVKDSTPIKEHYNGTINKSFDESSMNADGTTAISLVAPTNPTANLSTALAESYREGNPSLPGIQSWKQRTNAAKAAGSEYLNYQFGWAPLVGEVHSVVNAARYHRDIMSNYRHNEGKNIHRRFDFSPEIITWEESVLASPVFRPLPSTFNSGEVGNHEAQIVCEKTRKRWFEGCFTYGGPSETDYFRRALGFGSEADAVYGLTLTPDVLWNLTPWSWAVDWFTNAGDVIKNISNFALAGLVMRYGYMMEETSYTYYTRHNPVSYRTLLSQNPTKTGKAVMGANSRGITTVTKSRCPANPFGFGVGWEGLSPTQLAITAALGITRAL